ncbi:MAG: exo-alpha-sialidase [Candidatus Natronoplasma sp.]
MKSKIIVVAISVLIIISGMMIVFEEEELNESISRGLNLEDNSVKAQIEITTEPTIVTGEVEESLMEQHSSEGFAVRLNDTTVLNLFRRGEGHIGPPGKIMQRYYDIETGEWTEPEEVYNSSYDDRNVHGGITDEGRVVAFFRRRNEDGENVDTNIIYSDNGGETWSDRINISDIFEAGSFRPIGTLQKMNGKYIMPSYDHNSAEILSSEDGIEWESEVVIYDEHNSPSINEFDLAYLGDGNLVAIFRTDGKHLQKTSTDYGETWSEFETTNIIDGLEYGEKEQMRKPELLYREDEDRLYVITSENTDPPKDQRLWICSQDVSEGLPRADEYIIEDYKYRPLRDVSTRYFYGYPTYTQIGENEYLIIFSDTDHATTGDEDVFLFQFTMTILKTELKINVEGEGSTEPVEGTYKYKKGTVVTIEAISANGWKFDEWKGDVTDTETTIEITLDEDMEITAVFEKEENEISGFTLTFLIIAMVTACVIYKKDKR